MTVAEGTLSQQIDRIPNGDDGLRALREVHYWVALLSVLFARYRLAREKRQLGVRAMGRAIERARAAQAPSDAESFYSSVAEVIWWIAMLDETLWNTERDGMGSTGAPEDRFPGVLLLGIRYAGNRQVHDADVTGMQGNPY